MSCEVRGLPLWLVGMGSKSDRRYRLTFIVLHRNIQFFQRHLLKTLLSPLNCLCTFVEYQLAVYLLFPTGLNEWLGFRQLLHSACSDIKFQSGFFHRALVLLTHGAVDTSWELWWPTRASPSCDGKAQAVVTCCLLPSFCILSCVPMCPHKGTEGHCNRESSLQHWTWVNYMVAYYLQPSRLKIRMLRKVSQSQDTCIKITFLWKQNRQD